jgi:hypothetical protein
MSCLLKQVPKAHPSAQACHSPTVRFSPTQAGGRLAYGTQRKRRRPYPWRHSLPVPLRQRTVHAIASVCQTMLAANLCHSSHSAGAPPSMSSSRVGLCHNVPFRALCCVCVSHRPNRPCLAPAPRTKRARVQLSCCPCRHTLVATRSWASPQAPTTKGSCTRPAWDTCPARSARSTASFFPVLLWFCVAD